MFIRVLIDVELLLTLRDNGRNEMLCWTPQGRFSFWDQNLERTRNTPSAAVGTRIIGVAMYINVGALSDFNTGPGPGPNQLMSSIYLTPNGELTSVRHELNMLRLQIQNLYSFFSVQLQQQEGKEDDMVSPVSVLWQCV